jgi:hypothetical protein
MSTPQGLPSTFSSILLSSISSCSGEKARLVDSPTARDLLYPTLATGRGTFGTARKRLGRGSTVRHTRRFEATRLLGALALLAAAGCATDAGTRTTLPTLQPSDTDPAAGFERPPVMRASELLPPDVVEGPHHEVEEQVRTDGFVRLYTISSDFGTFEAHGDEMLRIRVREIQALAALDEMSKTKEFAAAAGRALQSPFVASWNLIRHPVDSVTGVPTGAWRAIQRASGLAAGERSELEDSALKEFIGFEARKRQIAYELAVDPYTSNKTLQSELNRIAWASYVGGLPSMFVPFVDEASAATANPAETSDGRLNDLLRHSSPEDLRRRNRIELAVMGIPEPLSDEFIAHPWYSPRRQTLLVESLAGLEGTENRAAFLELALTAESEDDAVFYERAAAVMRAYNDNTGRIQKVVTIEGRVSGYTEDRRLVVPLPVDHAIWARPTAVFARSFVQPQADDLAVRRTELLITGTLSPKARHEIRGLGIAFTEQALDHLRPAEAEKSGDVR